MSRSKNKYYKTKSYAHNTQAWIDIENSITNKTTKKIKK